jgi:hypothetical protein
VKAARHLSSGVIMDVNAFESVITPYARLSHANMELIKKLPRPPAVFPPAWSSVRDSVGEDKQTQPVPALAYAGLVFELMGNWVQFWSEIGQGMLKLVILSQQGLQEQSQGTTAKARKSVNDHARSRHTHARSAS